MINDDPGAPAGADTPEVDDDPLPLGTCVATGALALTNVPRSDVPAPELGPLPVVSTGALTLTNVRPDDPVVTGVAGVVE